MTRPALLLALAATTLACGPRLLPGTQIQENRDTRAIYDTLVAYRQAINARDPAAVIALVAPDYFDARGTPEPDDDVDARLLTEQLPRDLARLDAVKLDFNIRKIEVRQDRAVAEIFYDSWYRVKAPDKVIPRRDSDLSQVLLHKVNGKWLIQSGL